MPSWVGKNGKLHVPYKFFRTQLQIQYEKYPNDQYPEHSNLKIKTMVQIIKNKGIWHKRQVWVLSHVMHQEYLIMCTYKEDLEIMVVLR